MELIERDDEIRAVVGLLRRTPSEKRGLGFFGEEGTGKSSLLSIATQQAQTEGFTPCSVLLHRLALGAIETRLAAPSLSTSLRIESPDGLFKALESLGNSLVLIVDDYELLSVEMSAAISHFFRYSAKCKGLVFSVGEPTADLRRAVPSIPVPTSEAWIDLLLLKHLSLEGVGLLIADELGAPALSRLVTQVHTITGGNPLFARELIRHWEHANLVKRIGDYWDLGETSKLPRPTSLVALTENKVAELSGEELECLRTIALLRRPCRLEELRAILRGLKLETLAILCERGFVQEHDDLAGPSYTIRQVLVEERLIGGMSSTRRRVIHGKIATGLVNLEDSSLANVAELAEHFSLAAIPPPNLTHYLRSGTKAAARDGDAIRAAPLARRWLELATDQEERLEALSTLAELLNSTEPITALEAYTEALQLAGKKSQAATLLLGRAQAFRRLGRIEDGLEDLRRAAESATDDATRFDAQHGIAVFRGIRRHYEAAGPLLEQLAASAPDEPRRAKALGHLAQIMYTRGAVSAALEIGARAHSRTTDENHRTFLQSNCAWYSLLLGLWADAEDLLLAAWTTAEERGDLWNLINIRGDQARLAAWTGRPAQGIEFSRVALQLARQVGNPADIVFASTTLSEVLAEQGNWQASLTVLMDAPIDIIDHAEPRDWSITLATHASALVHTGQIDEATDMLDAAEAWLVDAPHFRILVDRVRGQVALAKGQPAVCRDICERALARNDQYELERAATHELLAEAMRLCRNREGQLLHGDRALSNYRALGATDRAVRVQNWIVKHRPGVPGRPRSRLVYTLTEREVEILWLVTCGQTNKQIGASLFIAEGTVSKHVENIKLKAGVSRRTELVTFAAKIGITPDSPPDLDRLRAD